MKKLNKLIILKYSTIIFLWASSPIATSYFKTYFNYNMCFAGLASVFGCASIIFLCNTNFSIINRADLFCNSVKIVVLGIIGRFIYVSFFYGALIFSKNIFGVTILNFTWPLILLLLSIKYDNEKHKEISTGVFNLILSSLFCFTGAFLIVFSGQQNLNYFSNITKSQSLLLLLAFLGATAWAVFCVFDSRWFKANKNTKKGDIKKYADFDKDKELEKILEQENDYWILNNTHCRHFFYNLISFVLTIIFWRIYASSHTCDKSIFSIKQLISILWLGLLTNGVAQVFWFDIYNKISIESQTIRNFFTPAVSMVLLFIYQKFIDDMGRAMNCYTIIGILLILFGNLLITKINPKSGEFKE